MGHQISKATESLWAEVCHVEVSVHAAMSALWTESASLQAVNQRLRDEIHQHQSVMAQSDSTLGLQRRVHLRSRSRSPEYDQPRSSNPYDKKNHKGIA
ncbi:hypothetical protein Plhal703r1_c03g0019291 [Plasmopara halstedii]